MIKVGGKQNPYELWQAGISLAASPLAKSLAGFAREEYIGSAATHPLTNPASYAGYLMPDDFTPQSETPWECKG